MRWGIEKRLEFIEFRLFWEGRINRSDIVSQFGVSVPQASKDLSRYESIAVGNLCYDTRAKRYRASRGFKPVLLEPDASAYLGHLRAGNGVGETASESWLAAAPAFDGMPLPQRRVDVAVLRDVLRAMRDGRSLEIRYQSMNAGRPVPEWRRITPHALGNDGLRWHARSFCHLDRKFKDFILSRCLGSRKLGEPGAAADDDRLWHERFAVALAPNPALSDSQRQVVARDYQMRDGRMEVPVRKALLYYFQKRLRLDVADKLDDPHEVPVVVANRAVFDAALLEATA